jgi:exodeoxyribonuclease VII large subunit
VEFSGRATTGLADDRRPRDVPRPFVWNVAALLQAASDALLARFGACVVRGEISGFMQAASGHCYFTLKDAERADGALRCAMFRRSSSLLDFAPADGQTVEARGRLGVYGPRGELQLVVESMQRGGAGALYERFLLLRARLERRGPLRRLRRSGRSLHSPRRSASSHRRPLRRCTTC